MLELIKVIILGIVEGVTEFLPISSTGHLIVFAALLDFKNALGGTFEIFIQFGAVVAVLIYFRSELWKQVAGVASDKASQRFWINLIIAFVPAAAIGFFFRDTIKEVLFRPSVVAASLIVGGIIFIIVERRQKSLPPAPTASMEAMTVRQALAIGIAQITALIPGVSRSGSTIVGGMLFGVDRAVARHDSHGGAVNQFDLNGKTLTVRGGNNWYFVNTNVIGTGVLDVSIGGEFNFEANAVLPAGMTMRLSNNTRSSSWDGAGKIMSGDVQIVDRGILENRQNDGGKTYAGNLSIGTQPDHQLTLRVTTENGTSNNFMNVTGKITGPGMLVRDGIDTEKVFLKNPSNDYSGGTVINSGILVVDAPGALPANNINVNGGSLDLNGNSQSMTSGLLKGGTIVGAGSVLTMDGPGVKEIRPGANVSVPVELSGGVIRPDHRAGDNVLGNALTGSMLVTGDSTLKPYQDPAQAAQPNRLHEYHRVGADLNTDDGVTGAIYSGTQDGIPAIDSTAKPFGDNNKWVYTGELINTTAGNLTVSFGEQYDDQIRVKVDGSTVLFDTGWNTATASGNAGQPGAVTLTPGAHSIEISSFDGSGGAGPNSQWDKGVGIREGSVYTLQGPAGDQGALSQADNAAFNKITSATLPAGLAISAPGVDNRADRSENKNIEIDPGVKLTVDTSDMQGKTYTLTGILSGGGSMIKAGSGTLALGGVSTYTGQTVVNQGTLKLLPGASLSPSSEITVAAGASIDASASGGITIPGGQTLDGNGSVIGNVIVAGELAPGNSIGQLTITGDLTLTGSSDFELDRNASPLNADNATVSGTLTYGGTLTLTNIGSPLVAGDTFNLFDAGTTTGSFSSITFPAGTTPADWINNLGTIGSLTYVPEPGSVGMGILATAILLRRRRK